MSGHDAPPGPPQFGSQDAPNYNAFEDQEQQPLSEAVAPAKKKSRRGADPSSQKRRCVSTACIACRKRKSKCDGAVPSCAACASVYNTECVYDPTSDHRRKGVYREKTDASKTRNGTLQILIEAILNAADDKEAFDIVKRIRTCDSLDAMADALLKKETEGVELPNLGEDNENDYSANQLLEGEQELARKMGELRLENGSVRYIGGTSHLIFTGDNAVDSTNNADELESEEPAVPDDPITSWTRVTKDKQLVNHLINMYFNWHYPYFVTLSKKLFFRDFLKGKPRIQPKTTVYCSSLLVNAMLALGCHFTAVPGAFAVPGDSRTKGDHFFAEAKRLIFENDLYAKPRLTTVQALALMSVREAGCGREANGWVYSGMSFRMAQDLGINLHLGGVSRDGGPLDEQEVDARRVTFWGCFLFDKCWSNYLGRLPQIPRNVHNVPMYDVFPEEDAATWSPYTDSGLDRTMQQPSRIRANGIHLSKLCEISSDLLLFFYHPNHIRRGNSKSAELKKLSELHRALEDWKKELPLEFDTKEGQLPHVILTHMFFHLQYIHLFKAFLKYTPETSPLPAHVSPWRVCIANAAAISKLMRLYKRNYNLRQICNIAVYMEQTACTIHMLNLPEKAARRDIIHGVKHLEEIAEDWLCARRALSILSVLSRKWNIELPEEAAIILKRSDEKYGTVSISDVPSPHQSSASSRATNSPPQSLSLSPTVNPSEAYSQAPYSSASQPMSLDYSSTTLASELMNDLVTSGIPTAIHNSNAMQQPVTTASPVVLTDPGTGITPWAISPATRTMPSYMQAYAPIHAQAHTPATTAHEQSPVSILPPPPHIGGPRHFQSHQHHSHHHHHQQQQQNQPQVTAQTPSPMFAIDGQDWYLRDSVNWQQNFQAWGVGSAGTTTNPSTTAGTPATTTTTAGGGTSSAANELGRTTATPSSSAAASPDANNNNNNVYMFRGVGGGGLGELDASGFEGLGSLGLVGLPGGLAGLDGLD